VRGVQYKGLKMAQTYTLDSPLPSGGWTLYFHPAKENRWHLDTFRQVAKVETFRDLGNIFAAITPNDWAKGKFFFTPDGIPPLMENARNIRGGAYSIRVERGIVGDVMKKHIIAAVLGELLVKKEDLVSCVRITPRRDFNILQVWNRDCTQYSNPNGLAQVDSRIPRNEIMYKPHVEKKI
jgi:hypothetical protein